MPKRLIDAPLSKQPFPIPPNARFRVVDEKGSSFPLGTIFTLSSDDDTNIPYFRCEVTKCIGSVRCWRLEMLDEYEAACPPKIVQGITLKDCEATRHEDVGKKVQSRVGTSIVTGWLLARNTRESINHHLILCSGEDWQGRPYTKKDGVIPYGTKNIAYVTYYELVEDTPCESRVDETLFRGLEKMLPGLALVEAEDAYEYPNKAYEKSFESFFWGQSFTKSKCATQTLMNNVITAIKNLALTAEDKLLRKHGVEDSNGEITEKGYELSAYLSYKANRDAIVKHLKEVDAEEEKKG